MVALRVRVRIQTTSHERPSQEFLNTCTRSLKQIIKSPPAHGTQRYVLFQFIPFGRNAVAYDSVQSGVGSRIQIRIRVRGRVWIRWRIWATSLYKIYIYCKPFSYILFNQQLYYLTNCCNYPFTYGTVVKMNQRFQPTNRSSYQLSHLTNCLHNR